MHPFSTVDDYAIQEDLRHEIWLLRGMLRAAVEVVLMSDNEGGYDRLLEAILDVLRDRLARLAEFETAATASLTTPARNSARGAEQPPAAPSPDTPLGAIS